MHIALLGANSQIAKDLIPFFDSSTTLYLFCRRKTEVIEWMESQNLPCRSIVCEYDNFFNNRYDAIINFVGSGNPAKTAELGSSIFEITHKFDSLSIEYLDLNPTCKYIFFSSGAAFGAVFDQPLDEKTVAMVDLNHMNHQDWYGVAKLYAECCHRARPDLSIVDLRVFSYFSKSQDINARFLLSDIARAIVEDKTLLISDDPMDRDYIHPSDLFQLISLILLHPKLNGAVDCYSKGPISKMKLIESIVERYGLKIEISPSSGIVNATGLKNKYFSVDKKAFSLGYKPKFDSLEGVLVEMDLLLKELN
jgi:nucleoside-diphosphate-sugar epimerase